MASLVQSASATGLDGYVNSLTITLPNAVAAGSALVMFNGNGSNTLNTIVSVTDNRGNSWTRVRSQVADFRGSELWVALNAAAGATTITVSSGSTYMRQSAVAHEVSGATTVQGSATFNDGANNYTTSHAIPITTTAASFIVAGYGGSDGTSTFTGSNGWSGLTQRANADGVTVTQSRDATTSGSYTATFTSANFENGSGAAVAFNVSAATPPDPVTKLDANPSDTSAIITWAKSSGATGYVLSYNSTTQTLGDVNMAIVTGLTNDTAVTFTVKARNSVGDSTTVTATATPIKPSNGVAPYSWHPFGVQPNLTAASMQASARTFYDNWFNFTLSASGMISAMPAGALRIAIPDQNIYPQPAGMLNGTVSEGQGYGLAAAAWFSNPQLPAGVYDPTAYAKFNGLLKYALYYRDEYNLMDWNIGSDGVRYGNGSASDGDYDIGIGMLIMHRIHGSSGAINYGQIATDYLTAFGNNCFAPANYPTYPHIALNGDKWGVDTNNYMSDYFRPGWLREFYYHTGDTKWLDRIAANYPQSLQYFFTNYLGGVVPDRQTRENTTVTGYSPFTATYNSVRLGFGIMTDYLWNGTVANSLGLNMMNKMADRFKALYGTGSAIRSPNYNMDGESTENYANGSALGMVAPAALGKSANQTFATELFNAMKNSTDQNNSYFNGGVALMSMMVASGIAQNYRAANVNPPDVAATLQKYNFGWFM